MKTAIVISTLIFSLCSSLADGELPLLSAKFWQTATVEDVNSAVANGADVSAEITGGWTALMVAAERNTSPDVVERLVKLGADVNAKLDDGCTVLMIAAEDNPNPDVVERLVKLGADINARDNRRATALMAAVRFNTNPDVIERLVKMGADANVRGKTGRTALMIAARFNKHPDVVELLVKKGADLNARDKNRATALMYAAKFNTNSAVVERLVKMGAEVSSVVVGCAEANKALQGTETYQMLTDAVNQKKTGANIRPVVPSLEQVSHVSSFRLGQGYRAVKSTISTLETAIKFPNVTILLNIDGKMVKITQENAPGILKAFKERLQVYRRAIRQRGYRKIKGWYTVQVNEALEGEEGFDMVELFADAKLSSKEYLLAREIQIKQKDFNVQMVREIDFGGEKKDVSFPGLMIGDSIVFEVPNIEIRFYGTLHDDTIELRLDLNEVKRSLSFKHAMQPLVDPEKAKDSELYKENFSGWIVRLKRKPSNRPAEPSPADQLLILTPDKKLRKVVRAQISPTSKAEEPHKKN